MALFTLWTTGASGSCLMFFNRSVLQHFTPTALYKGHAIQSNAYYNVIKFKITTGDSYFFITCRSKLQYNTYTNVEQDTDFFNISSTCDNTR